MKTKVKFLFLILLSGISAAACSDSGAKSSVKHQDNNPEEPGLQSMKEGEKILFGFENYITGQHPSGWSEYYTGQGSTEWKIIDDQGNKVLAQLYRNNPGDHFNIVVYDSLTPKDVMLTARLKAVTGNHDQGGGFVWRFIDRNNYYVVRANPLENNVVLYKMENGRRTDLPLIGKGRTYGLAVPTMGLTWHSLKLEVKGSLFIIYLDNTELFRVEDSTFPNGGKVGFWTKADAVTYFDDFEILIY